MNEKVLAEAESSRDQRQGHQPARRLNPLKIPQARECVDSPPLPHERWLARRVLMFAGKPPVSIILWDGEEVSAFDESDAQGEVEYSLHLKDRRALYKLGMNPNLAFGDLYSAGRLEVNGPLEDLFTALFPVSTRAKDDMTLWLKAFWRDPAPRSPAVDDARNNIHHHYDLGNEFYALWLDQAEMQYTWAYYESDDLTLEQAQLAKLEHVCRKLQLRPGQTVVGAGCGWGGLARYMAREHGVKVLAYNISREQVHYARQLLRR